MQRLLLVLSRRGVANKPCWHSQKPCSFARRASAQQFCTSEVVAAQSRTSVPFDSNKLQTDPPVRSFLTSGTGDLHHAQAEIQGHKVIFETGRLAVQAAGACTASSGSTQVLATVSLAQDDGWRFKEPFEHFEVEYVESMAASGRLPSTSNRREVASDRTLAARQTIARALRPLLPPGFTHSCKVTATLLSSDRQLDPMALAINAASAALATSSVPWHGPLGAVMVCSQKGTLCFQPTAAQLADADFSLLFSGSSSAAVAIQSEGAALSEEQLMRTIQSAAEEADKLINAQQALVRQAGRIKTDLPMFGVPDPAALSRIALLSAPRIQAILADERLAGCMQRSEQLEAAKRTVLGELRAAGAVRSERIRTPGSTLVSPSDLDHSWPLLQRQALQHMILTQNVRPGGMGLADLRPASCQVDLLPGGVHGSGLMTQGEAQCLATATVGGDNEERRNDSVLGKSTDRIILYANTPALPVAQGRVRHREAAEEARAQNGLLQQILSPLLPPAAQLPFVLRIVVDNLGIAGPPAMPALNAAALAAISANFPLSHNITGVTIGLFSSSGDSQELAAPPGRQQHAYSWQQALADPETVRGRSSRWELVTDVDDEEAELGDMMLHVCGHADGITCIQLECNNSGVPLAVIAAALKRARAAHARLLAVRMAVLNQRAGGTGPCFSKLAIPKESVGRLIGQGGSTIQALQERYSARIVVPGDGFVHFFTQSAAANLAVKSDIESLTGIGLVDGAVYPCTVTSMRDYGVLVRLDSGQELLLHISELADHRVQNIEDEVKIGQRLAVRVTGRDHRGLFRLSRKGLMKAI